MIFFLRIECECVSKYEYSDAQSAHFQSLWIRQLTLAQKLTARIYFGGEIEAGSGGSLSPDFYSFSDCITCECLDPQVAMNAPACRSRQDQVDCFSPSEKE